MDNKALKKTPTTKEQRKLNINTYSNELFKQTQSFCSNQIRTAKYNIFTFLPLALFFQFRSAFNLFFLATAIILSIPLISSIEPFTNITPFLAVLIISLIREALEDLRKYQYDSKSNKSITFTYKGNEFIQTTWASVQVGEIIKVTKNEIIPADLIVIKSSGNNGLCYLETTNLDGENTLKPRESLSIGQKNIVADISIGTLLSDSKIEVDPPSMDIYSIEGTAFIGTEPKIYFDIKNILLRGGRLKNVDHVYGIVIYTGRDTKLMQNINHSSMKFSVIDRKLDIIVLYILGICLFTCIICTIVGGLFRERYFPDYENGHLNGDYMLFYSNEEAKNDVLEIVRIFAANFLTFNTLIPISIIIVLAVAKALQAIIIELIDPSLRLDPGDQVHCLTTTLQEDMGMVKYIFTDKTGTLTRNEMDFKACSIFTMLFDDDEEKEENKDNMSCKKLTNGLPTVTHTNSRFSKTFNKERMNFELHRNIPLMINDIKGCPYNSQNEAIWDFFLNMAINHDVLTEYDNEKKVNIFQGANPDEVTLVTASAEMGFRFIERYDKVIKIGIKNAQDQEFFLTFELIQKFDFTSSRQRSSIIVKDTATNQIKLYLKGSDTKVFESLDKFSQTNIFPKSKEHVDGFARRGLRTLCYSMKILDEKVFKEWENYYAALKYKCINDKSLYPELENAISEIESNATLLGVSALEDKLQDNVRNDLQNFIEADINVWMITGDKMDTAESIGHSCKLFNDDTEVFKIKDHTNKKFVIERMKEIQNSMKILSDELRDIIKASEEIPMKKEEDIPNNNQEINNNNNNNNKEINLENHIDYVPKPITNKDYESSSQIIFPITQYKSMIQVEPNQKKNQTPDINPMKNNDNYNNNHFLMRSFSDKGKQRKESFKKIELKDLNENFAEMDTIPNNNMDLNYYNSDHNNSLRYLNDDQQSNINIYPIIHRTGSVHNNENKEKAHKSNSSNNQKISQNDKVSSQSYQNSAAFLNKKVLSYNEVVGIKPNIDGLESLASNGGGNKNNEVDNVSIFRFMVNKNYFENSDAQYDNMTLLQGKVRKASISNNEMSDDNSNTPGGDHLNNNPNHEHQHKHAHHDINIPISDKKFNEYFRYCREQLLQLRKARRELFKLTNKDENEGFEIEMNFGLIIEGQSITNCIAPGEAGDLFWDLITKSRSLICCRCSPIQKAQVVDFVKKRTVNITLAIGDGGNDVNMIKTAHVGIGLFGKEGYQAAYSSDYAISQFKYLKQLIFIIGRFSLERNSYFIYFYFFKNLIYNSSILALFIQWI